MMDVPSDIPNKFFLSARPIYIGFNRTQAELKLSMLRNLLRPSLFIHSFESAPNNYYYFAIGE